jgi:hypothetical protein
MLSVYLSLICEDFQHLPLEATSQAWAGRAQARRLGLACSGLQLLFDWLRNLEAGMWLRFLGHKRFVAAGTRAS